MVKERVLSKRAATKQIKYDMSEDNSSSSGGEELFDNVAIKENDQRQEKINLSSDSENESPPPRNETSEDMFDTLIGRKKDDAVDSSQSEIQKRKKINSDSDSDMFSSEKEMSKPKTKKKKVDSDEGKKQKPKKKKKSSDDEDIEVAKKPKSKKKKSSEDEDFEITKKTKSKKKKASSDSDEESESPPIKTGRVGRNAKQTKYVFDSDESD